MHTALSAWVLAITRALEEAGVDPRPLLDGAGMDSTRLGDLSFRYSQEHVTSLWIAAVAATADETFGLKVARQVRPSTFHVVGYAMSCSATLKNAAERFARSARLVSDSATVEFEPVETGYLLTVDLNSRGRPPIYQTIDGILGSFLLLCEWIQTTPIVPLRVTFRHAAVPDTTVYNDLFHVPVEFDQPQDSILFAAADLERPVPSANEDLALMLNEMTSRYLALRFGAPFSRRVREALVSQLPNGEPGKAETARVMGMTGRTLLRRLADENTSFQEVLDRLREELAYDYLRRDDLNVQNIAYMLGFSGSSTFSRAFMRWTGLRPSDWREHQTRQRFEAATV